MTDQAAAAAPPESAGARLDDVLERVSDAFVALDKEWRCTYVNQRAAQLFGWRPEDLVGRHIWTAFPEGFSDVRRGGEDDQDVLAADQRAAVPAGPGGMNR